MEIINLITALFCALMLGMYTLTLAIKPQLSKKRNKRNTFLDYILHSMLYS